MKITVITPFDSSNYGAFLQAYCLKVFLEKQGHQVFHLKVRSEDYIRSLFYHDVPITRKEKYLPGYYVKKKQFGLQKYELFMKEQTCFNTTENPEGSDLVILGSDEIWNLQKTAFAEPAFWGNESVPAISYAASIGNMPNDYPQYFENHMQQLRTLKTFLVRDERTKRFVEENTGRSAEIVCDPTMLIPLSEYGREFHDQYLDNNRCLLVYSYDITSSEAKAIRKYAKENRLKVVACCFNHPWADYQLHCGPLDFSSVIRQCEALLTTTFHGTIFGVLNHANFITVSRSIKTDYLLEELGLEGRRINGKLSVAELSELFGSAIDYSPVIKKIEILRNQSADRLLNAIQVNGRSAFETLDCFINNCTGCFLCKYVCPVNAISISEDCYGKTIPLIDAAKCIHCNACRKMCPQLNGVDSVIPEKCLAVRGKDEQEIYGSSSGGVGFLLAKQMILNGGKVCGCVVEDGTARHRLISDLSNLELLKGSKYVQSDISEMFPIIKQELESETDILFIGTPCQVAAMRKVFGRYDNFYCADIICHGVPPMNYLDQHIKTTTGVNDYDSFSFRGMPVDFTFKVFRKNSLIHEKFKDEDSYYYSFLKGLSYRENCYSCKYAEPKRVGDITLGDFWKINTKTLRNEYSGNISMAAINNQKGAVMFDAVKCGTVWEERDYMEAVRGNPQLRRPALRNSKRNSFLINYFKKKDFDSAVNSTALSKDMKRSRIAKSWLGKVLRELRKAATEK